jgi:hypothetical protein
MSNLSKPPPLTLVGPPPPPERVRQQPCNLCGRAAGVRCSRKGSHLARWLGAYAAKAINRDELVSVIVGLVVLHAKVIVPERAA